MAYNEKQQEWLDAISEHVEPEAARGIAEELFGNDHRLVDQPQGLISQLVDLGYLHRNDNGNYITKFPGPFI